MRSVCILSIPVYDTPSLCLCLSLTLSLHAPEHIVPSVCLSSLYLATVINPHTQWLMLLLITTSEIIIQPVPVQQTMHEQGIQRARKGWGICVSMDRKWSALTLAPRNLASSSSCFLGSNVVWKWSIWVAVIAPRVSVHWSHSSSSSSSHSLFGWISGCLLLLLPRQFIDLCGTRVLCFS